MRDEITRYTEYPAFQQRLQAIDTAFQQDYEALSQAAHELMSTHTSEAQATQIAATHAEQLRTLHEQRTQQIREAHQALNVPVLTEWEEALATTGAARYHDIQPVPGKQQAVTLHTHGEQVTVDLHITYSFPNQHASGRKVDDFLTRWDLVFPTWEAIEGHSS